MAKVTRLPNNKAARLRQTVNTERGLRLPPVARSRSAKGLWRAALALPVVAFALILLWPDTASIGALFSGTDNRPRYMSVSSPWVTNPEPAEAAVSQVYYAGCDDVRAAGKAPLYYGQPGYRGEMDGDGDGVACEPYR